MTQARLHVAAPGQQGLYHCVTRCVRRAWLCGVDPLTKIDHEARRAMVEARIHELGSSFSMAIYGYAVMSNHLHVVIAVEPSVRLALDPLATVSRGSP